MLTPEVRCEASRYSQQGYSIHQNLSESEPETAPSDVVSRRAPHVPDNLKQKRTDMYTVASG
jgi:hypothetical protein